MGKTRQFFGKELYDYVLSIWKSALIILYQGVHQDESEENSLSLRETRRSHD